MKAVPGQIISLLQILMFLLYSEKGHVAVIVAMIVVIMVVMEMVMTMMVALVAVILVVMEMVMTMRTTPVPGPSQQLLQHMISQTTSKHCDQDPGDFMGSPVHPATTRACE